MKNSSITSDLIDKLKPDRTLAEPVYQQLMRRILSLIESGEIVGNDSLPSERLLPKNSRSAAPQFVVVLIPTEK